MNAGDKVHVTYIEALVLELKKGNDLAVARTDEASGKGRRRERNRTASLAVASPPSPMSSLSTAKRRLSRCEDRNSLWT
jgi:hypothetical protein